MKSINPTTLELIKEYPTHNLKSIEQTIKKTQAAYIQWSTTTFSNRSKLMKKAADILRKNIDKYAKLMTEEMGKPITAAKAEIEKCIWVCEYYANNAENFLADENIKTEAQESFASYQPMGIVFAVMPWNFPFWQVLRFAAPAIMAGNASLLKHASNVPGCAIAIEELFKDAGFPEHLFSTLLINSKQVRKVIQNKHVKAVTLTGSYSAGSAVASEAGKLIKKSVLELGGNDPYIILKDANIKHAAESCVASRMINNGQSCIAAKRFIAVKEIYDDFVEQTKKEMANFVMGEPAKAETKLGPLATQDLRDELHSQVTKSIKQGAKCIMGGKIPNKQGAFYPATILVDIPKDSPAYKDELFGPVACIFKAEDEGHAIEIANDSVFGLGSAIFSTNTDHAKQLARTKINAGCCFINDFVKSDPRLPFGGINESGYGRELSIYGIKEFVNIKTVSIS